jgi:ABC-type multidrug transport system permease subunit
MFKARNMEFFRDRAAFGWNFLFPFLLIAGFAIIFGGKEYTEYKIGVFPYPDSRVTSQDLNINDTFKQTRYLNFIGFPSLEKGLEKLIHHKIDILVQLESPSNAYWVSSSSPKGYLMERIYSASLSPMDPLTLVEKKAIRGQEIRYIDWLFPGILAMNMMFSALWGVGYIIVRYRKNGVLKRLKATPLTAFEYLSAQLMSRTFLLMFTLTIVWLGCDLIFGFRVEGSYLNLAIVFSLGGFSLTSLGLLVAARGISEEFTSGVLNFITWPMMFLSEVWFSLEGAPHWVKTFAQILPLTHMLTGIRKIMNDGAGLLDVHWECTVLVLMSAIFLAVGAKLFSWNQ